MLQESLDESGGRQERSEEEKKELEEKPKGKDGRRMKEAEKKWSEEDLGFERQ